MADSDRRRILKTLLVGAAGLAARSSAAGAGAAGAPATPRALVARGRREGLVGSGGGVDPAKLDDLLGKAVSTAAGEPGPVEAMRKLFRPTDVVGIKVNCIAGRGLSPDPKLVETLTGWLQKAGVETRNIVIWDRSDRELARAGFVVSREPGGIRSFGVNDDYDWKPREWGAGGSCFAKILVSDITALINVGVLKDHDLAGVSVGLKNWYGAIHNPNKHHDHGCDPYVAHLAAYPLIRDKLRLTVIDGMTAQCHGGPARAPHWSWPWQGVIAGTDPVAVDAVGWRIIESRRKEVGLPTLTDEKREPKWIATAGKIGLGEPDPARIKLVEV